MKSLCCRMSIVLAVLCGLAPAQPAHRGPAPGSGRERLIGAWHLVSLRAPGADGKMAGVPGLKGMLIYTRDGHMAVQLMYPLSESALSNEYVRNGYEASFGSYDVNEAAHTVTHHVEGSITPGLAGKSLIRVYRFTRDGRLIITSARPDEHWSVTWEHD
jgi:Lipocalin-like domain